MPYRCPSLPGGVGICTAGGLAYTGSNILVLGFSAALFLIVGVLMLRIGAVRRRSSAASQGRPRGHAGQGDQTGRAGS